jgi:ribosomal-protein-serine acetyltransferase
MSTTVSPTISIRRYEPTDVDALYEAIHESRAELAPWMPWCHADYVRDETAAWVESRVSVWEQLTEWSFVIVDSEGRILGSCGFHRLDLLNGCGEVGYWVRTSATGQGIASAAVRQVTQWAFLEQGLHRVEMLISTENFPSLRVAAKSGATCEGVLRQRLLLQGRHHDAMSWAILKE